MPTREENAAILHPMWAALVSEAEARLFRAIDHATAGGLTILLDRTGGTLPDNAHGPVQDESVVVAIDALPTIATQEAFNAYVLAALQAINVAAFDPDTILTNADGDVVVNADGFVLTSGAS